MIKRLRLALVGLLALALMGGAVALTGFFLTGSIKSETTTAFAEFTICGQGIRPGGDVKLRGVLVGRIEGIERVGGGDCRVEMGLQPSDVDQIPANVGAEVRAKTVFGEKWVELTLPDSEVEDRIAKGDVIPTDRTLDPLEVETILGTALPILDAIDPEALAGALEALAEGFVGHEDSAIKGIREGIAALEPMNDNAGLIAKGIDQLDETGASFARIDQDLVEALDNLDDFNRFTVANQALIASNLQKAPALLGELSSLFETRFNDITKLVSSGATVIGILSARTEDVDRLLHVLPRFNSSWIRNLNHVCRFRQATDEPGKARGDVVPGRCWRVHNIVSTSQGPYTPEDKPRPKSSDFEALGLLDPSPIGRLLYAPALPGSGGAI